MKITVEGETITLALQPKGALQCRKVEITPMPLGRLLGKAYGFVVKTEDGAVVEPGTFTIEGEDWADWGTSVNDYEFICAKFCAKTGYTADPLA